MDFKQEIKNLTMVSVFASICLCYCYLVGKRKRIPKGFPRLLMILPVVVVFVWIPLLFNSVHLIGAVSFFISWLANFKLLLFAFGKGPLSAPSIPLSRFLSFACFPIAMNGNNNSPRRPPPSHINNNNNKLSVFLNYGVKSLLLGIFLRVYYDYGVDMNPMVAWIVFAFSVYFCLELMLAISSMIIGFLLVVELDPQFNEPYLSTSLQDFWGRRWNVMVNRILYPTIYSPVHTLSTRVIGRMWAPIPAILTTFAVSGLMHELIFFYFTREWPTWDTTLFFCLHGVCLVTEIVMKKSLVMKKELKWVSTPFVVIFVLGTSYWLFFPELVRCKIMERAFEEYKAMANIAATLMSCHSNPT